MADRGGFVNVPGKGRRFRTPEGEYRYGAPGDVTAGIIPRIEKFFGRLFAPNPLQGDPTGRYIPGNMQVPFTVPAAPVLSAAANSATGGGGGQPQFKAQPMTSQGQFDRYFGTSEMDPFFGSSSRGAGAPKTAEEMMALATQQKAPMETPLSTYYRSQSAAGRAEMPAITEGLGYAKGTPLAQWAEANPMLAKRLFEKTKAKKAAGTEEDAYAHPRDLGAGAQAEQGYTLAAYGLK
jgi:hypothetical protein